MDLVSGTRGTTPGHVPHLSRWHERDGQGHPPYRVSRVPLPVPVAVSLVGGV